MTEPARTRRPEVDDHDVDIRVVLAGLLVVALLVVLGLLVSGGVLAGAEALLARGDAEPSPVTGADARRLPPEPRLSPVPPAELERVRREADAVLRHYGWTDADAGLVRVPAARALELVLERGLPPAGFDALAPSPAVEEDRR